MSAGRRAQTPKQRDRARRKERAYSEQTTANQHSLNEDRPNVVTMSFEEMQAWAQEARA